MTIADAAERMGAPSDEYVEYIRQYHPFGENEEEEITHSQKILHTRTEIPWIYHTSKQISHDTNNRGQPTMGVGNVPDIIQQNLRQCNTQQIQVLGDGHCARRALAKNLNMEPGQLIQLISTTCNALHNLGTAEGEAVIDARALDYRQIETYANNMAQFAGHNKVKENEQMTCTRDQWGGEFEIKITANITDTPVLVINLENRCIEIHWPSMALPATHIPVNTATIMKAIISIIKDTYNDCIMIMYNSFHYNAIIENQKCQKDDFRKPIQLVYEKIHTNNVHTTVSSSRETTR